MELPSHSYRVRRETAFAWTYPTGKDAESVRDLKRKHHKESLELASAKIVVKLRRIAGEDCKVTVINAKRKPQLRFELTVVAPNVNEATRIACLRIERAMTTKVTVDRNPRTAPVRGGRPRKLPSQDRTLRPPWGAIEATVK